MKWLLVAAAVCPTFAFANDSTIAAIPGVRCAAIVQELDHGPETVIKRAIKLYLRGIRGGAQIGPDESEAFHAALRATCATKKQTFGTAARAAAQITIAMRGN